MKTKAFKLTALVLSVVVVFSLTSLGALALDETPPLNSREVTIGESENQEAMVTEESKDAAPMEENKSLFAAKSMVFYIQAKDGGKPLQGSVGYEPGLMGDMPSHSSPNKFGAVTLSVAQMPGDQYTYFPYGRSDLYEPPVNSTLILPVSGTLIKVNLAKKGSGQTTIELIRPGESGYPTDPMNPDNEPSAQKTLQGVVKDSLGNGIADAEVTIKHAYKPASRTTTTNSQGVYSITNIPETQFGTAEILAAKQGFNIVPSTGKEGDLNYLVAFGMLDSKNYDFVATSDGGSPSDTFKKFSGAVSGKAPSGSVQITFEAENMKTQVVTLANSKFSCKLDKVEYTGKTITITPKLRGFKFIPSSQQVQFDDYVSGAPVTFDSENDGERSLEIEADIPNVKYTVSAGGTCEYFTGSSNFTMIGLLDEFYLNKKVTVVPSKEGYSFSPSYISFNYAPGGTVYEYELTSSKTPVTGTKDLVAIVTHEVNGKPIEGVNLDLGTNPTKQGVTNADGMCTMSGLKAEDFPTGAVALTLAKQGFTFAPRTLAFADVGVMALSQSEAVNNNEKIVNVTLTANPTGGGTVYGAGAVPINSIATLTAVANEKWEFVDWTEPLLPSTPISTNSTYAVQVAKDLRLQANFKKNTGAPAPVTAALTVTPNITAAGTSSGTGSYPSGTPVMLYAKSKEGYKFKHWAEGNNVLSTSSSYQITTTDKPRTIIAVFESTSSTAVRHQISTTANPTEGGTVMGTGTYDEGQAITVIATAASGYAFTNWTENSTEVSKTPSYSFAVNGDRSLTANFNLSTNPPDPDPDPNPNPNPDPNPNPNPNPNPDPNPGKPNPNPPVPVERPSDDRESNTTSERETKASSATATAQTKPSVTLDRAGNAKATIPDSTFEVLIKAAKAAAKKNGTSTTSVTVKVEAKSTANSLSVPLSRGALKKLIDARVDNLIIKSDLITTQLDLTALKHLQSQTYNAITVVSTRADSKKLPREAQSAIGNRPLFKITASYQKNGKRVNITNFGKGKITVTVPYTLGKNEKAENVCAVLVDAKGKLTYIAESTYNTKTKQLTFPGSVFSAYGVAYKITDK